jgi:CubicO group peptidase (beta-lactamase class C family)
MPPRAANADPIQSIQHLIDDYYRRSLNEHGANVGVVVGIVTPDNVARNGQVISAGGETLTNPFGKRLELNERTLFEIGSISKVFTSGIYYMLRGNYDGTLGSRLGRNIRLSEAMAAIPIKDLAIYRPGLAQDNQGGVYPPGTMANLPSLFRYMGSFTPPNAPGSCFAYSNVGWSLLGMAAVGLDSADTQVFVRAYNAKLVKYCSAFSAPGTQVFDPDLKPRLPQGYSKEFVPLPPTGAYEPTPAVAYASGGIISNGADMMRFLLYSMGRLPGGLNDAALKSQQAETFGVAPCSGTGGGPVTSYGWFHAKFAAPSGEAVVVNKNGGVAGFTSWMGFSSWQGTGAPSSHGLFVLSNSPASTRIGDAAMKLLLRG